MKSRGAPMAPDSIVFCLVSFEGPEPYAQAGGLVFTGATGEDYTLGDRSAVVLDTDRPEEIVIRLLDLRSRPNRAQAIRRTGREHASNFTSKRVADILLDNVSFVAHATGALRR